MARRIRSERLETTFSCPVSWENMRGGADRRFCGECRCEVFDFAQMEPRAVAARLEASRGRLCARITRRDGQVTMLQPAAPEPLPARPPERAPGLAAGLFGAWLTLAAAAAASQPGNVAPIAASPSDPGEREGKAAGPGTAAHPADGDAAAFSEAIEVNATLEGVSESVSVGMVVFSIPALHQLFDESELVFVGRVDASEVLAVNDGLAEVRTTLRVGRRFKGDGWDRFVTYRHSLPVEAFGPDQTNPLPELTPGTMVLAFLSFAQGEVDGAGRPVFESTLFSGLRRLPAAAVEAYSDRLEQLAQLRRAAGPEGDLDPAGLLEWQVAMAEDPATRHEETADEIRTRLEELTEDQQVRLAAALLATDEMDWEDLRLYELVKSFDAPSAALWVAETLSRGETPQGDHLAGWLAKFAEPLAEAEKRPLIAATDALLAQLDERFPFDLAAESDDARQQALDEIRREVFAELALLLREN